MRIAKIKMDRKTLTNILYLVVCLEVSAAQNSNLVRSRNTEEWRPRTRGTVCVPRDCRLPDCYCASKTGPSHLRNYQIPQMVMLSFDDAINEQVNGYYERLFSRERLNPNGCPISATFYLSHNWTNYDMVRNLYRSGHEISSHSVTHRLPQSWWTHASLKDWYKEVNGQRKNIINKAGVPKSQVRGMRVPFLELGGDKQFSMMADTGIAYDSSFMTGPYDEGGAWPFTLDYPPNWKYCSNNNCPKSSFPGIWELPMNRWIGPDGKPCPMVDACQTQPLDKKDTLGYMWYNFNRFYRGNRAPFGIHLHAVWFKKEDSYFDALETFLDALTNMDDVYVVSASQIIAWMKRPTAIKDINSFLPWRRTCLMKEVRKQTTTTAKPPTTTRRTTTTTRKSTTTHKTTTPPTTSTVPETKPSRTPATTAEPTTTHMQRQEANQRLAQPINKWPDRSSDNNIKIEGHEWRPSDVNSRGSRRHDVPVYQGPPNREELYRPSRGESRGKPTEVTSEVPEGTSLGQSNPWQPRSNIQPSEHILQENIKVEIDVNNEVNKDVVRKPGNVLNEIRSKDLVTNGESNRVKDAYESAREEANTADQPLYQSKRNGGNLGQICSFGLIMSLLLIKTLLLG